MTMSAMKLKGLPGPQLYCECLQCHQQDGRASEIYLDIYTLDVYIYICTVHTNIIYIYMDTSEIIRNQKYPGPFWPLSAMLQIVDVF